MKIFFTSILLLQTVCVVAQDGSETFPPPAVAPVVYAGETKETIVVDDKLNEATWHSAPVIKDFFRMEPRQGGQYKHETFVRIVYDTKNLYFGVFCKDGAGKKRVRVQDYRRDFSYPDNDEFFYFRWTRNQYKSYDKSSRWNVRGSWEFAPLRFFYIVFNENDFRETPVQNQSLISKVSYIKQF